MLRMLLQQGFSAWQQGATNKAERLLRAALQIHPANFDALHLLGLIAAESNQHELAVELINEALRIHPGEPAARLNLAGSLRQLKRHEEALAHLEQVRRIAPEMAEAHHNCGNVLRELGRHDEALQAFSDALALAPSDADSLTGQGATLFSIGHYAEARIALAAARQQQPDHPNATWNESLLQLLHGELHAGWAAYEAGGAAGTRDIQRGFGCPVWRGNTPLAGLRILLHAEQGLGDTLQFCRYAKSVKDAGAAEVILEVQSPLRRLLQGLSGVDRLCVRGEALPAFDLSCPLLSLPGIFDTSLTSIPLPPVLNIPAPCRQTAQQHLKQFRRPRVGLVWSGNPAHVNDRERSLSFTQLKPLFDADLPLQWISLQKGERIDDKEALRSHPDVSDVSELLHDFADTAALISGLDLLITVDTAAAHLSASLGTPTWILLPAVPDWRWLLERDDSPWYPAVQLFRRKAHEDWQTLICERLLPTLEARNF